MNIHELKSWVGLFEPLIQGQKKHDLRVMDREYNVGDTLRLREYEPVSKTYTGREAFFRSEEHTSELQSHSS